MAFIDMIGEVRGAVPKVPLAAAKKFVNKGWKDVRESGMWSFQLFEGIWITPPLIKAGTVTTVQGSNQVTFDATAQVAINASATTYSLVTQRQFRVAAGTIYNIWAYDPATGIATLDKMYGEASAVGVAYQIYQVYYAPVTAGTNGMQFVPDFLTFVSVRNMQNFIDLFLEKTRAQLDATDPQRTWYYFPTDCVPYQVDPNPASVSYGVPLFELWGAPQSQYSYQLYGIRRGADLVNPSDTLPFSVGEDCVIERAKRYAYEWAEANKGENRRDVGPNFQFLMGKADAEYLRLMKKYRMRDREFVNNWFSIRRLSLYGKFFAYYNSIGGTAYPGVAFGG